MPLFNQEIADRIESAKRALAAYDPNFLALERGDDYDRQTLAIGLMLSLMHYLDALPETVVDVIPDVLGLLRTVYRDDQAATVDDVPGPGCRHCGGECVEVFCESCDRPHCGNDPDYPCLTGDQPCPCCGGMEPVLPPGIPDWEQIARDHNPGCAWIAAQGTICAYCGRALEDNEEGGSCGSLGHDTDCPSVVGDYSNGKVD